MLKLTVYENGTVQSELELNKGEELIAGRSQKTGLVLSHEKISREHFKIYFNAGQWIVKDLGSKNGTVINGSKITEQAVADGDVIKLANFSIKVRLEELKPSPSEDATVIADEGEFGANIPAEPTVKDSRRFSTPPSEEQQAGEEVPGEEAGGPVYDKTEVIKPVDEEPGPVYDKTEVITPPAGGPEPGYEKTEIIGSVPEEPGTEAEEKGEEEDVEEPAGERNKIEVIEGKTESDVSEFDDHILVGRSTGCDLVILDQTVSREHFKISNIKNKYILTNINRNNATYLNGRTIKKAAVKDGDIIKVGDNTLKVVLPGREEVEKKSSLKVVAAAVAVIVPGALLAMMFLGGERVETAVKGILERIDAVENKYITGTETVGKMPGQETRRSDKIELYLGEGKEFFDKGDFADALQSFSIVIAIDPENSEALAHIEKCLLKIREKRISGDEAEVKRIELEKKMEDLLSEARKLYEGGQYKRAKAALAEAGDLSSSGKEVSDLLSQINARMSEEQRVRDEEQRRKKLLDDARADFARGMKHYNVSEYYPALVEFRKVISLNVNSSETARAEKLIFEINEILSEMTAEPYESGKKYYINDNYEDAMIMWRKVLDIDPEHAKAKKGMEEILDRKAGKLYQEGVDLEKAGNIEEAVNKWEEVIKVLPVRTNEYYRKAIGKLEEHR